MEPTGLDSLLKQVQDRVSALPPKERAALEKDVVAPTTDMRFVPLPGPQTDTYLSLADIVLYGGKAGGGKTALLVGLAQEHEQSIIFRREKTQTDGLERFGKELYGTEGFNGTDLEWSWSGGRSLKLAGMRDADSWNDHAGRARDFMGFDEGGEFLAIQVFSIMAWNRGRVDPVTGKTQRCRIVFASNPPRTAEGAWMLDWWAPWLDPKWPNRAKPGELRYAFMDPDRMQPEWVEKGTTRIDEDSGDVVHPLSFTFIPADLKDNPYNDTAEYRAKLNALPEPLRSQLKLGIFTLGGNDDPWQLIPTEWIKAAMDRWTPRPPDNVPMTALGADVAQGGGDDTTLAPRYDGWYDKISETPGVQTPGGREVSGLVVATRKHGATIILDVGGGWGSDAYGCLRGDNRMSERECVAYMGVKPSFARSRDNLFRFVNMRSQLLWQFREALDPDQVGGSPISLPPDNELLADLAAPTYEVKNRAHDGQFIEALSKEKVVAKLGRSPNKGDAVVMAWYAGAKSLVRRYIDNPEHGRAGSRNTLQVNYGSRRQNGITRRM